MTTETVTGGQLQEQSYISVNTESTPGVPGIGRLLRFGEGQRLRRIGQTADLIQSLEDDFRPQDDERAVDNADLIACTADYRARLAENKATLDDLLPEAFATICEAADRTLGMRPFKVQIMGGIVLHEGNIAEMKTGEGKTLMETTAAYLNALTGEGVHIVTVNDHLASIQSEKMGRIFSAVGMRTGCIQANMNPEDRKQQYAADITYGTANEFGFDYLRDNIAVNTEDQVQRGLHYAIIDEADSILIDEARSPLIISENVDQLDGYRYAHCAQVASRLEAGVHYTVDSKDRTVSVTEAGTARLEDLFGTDNFYAEDNILYIRMMQNALEAKELFKKDKDYVVLDDQIRIVDEHTGRILHGRSYPEGTEQAIQVKEGVPVEPEVATKATITLQNYFKLYDKIAGMTGTALDQDAEFRHTFGMNVVPIPTNRPMIRIDRSDVIYQTEAAKLRAVLADTVARHELGQPVLIGTTSVEKNQQLADLFARYCPDMSVVFLNAKNHEQEAAIIALAGRLNAVTVATNMAGRGTDILLGGDPESIARNQMLQDGHDDPETQEYKEAWPEALKNATERVSLEHDAVARRGGLYVIGTERHESRRIDNQLRGRAGRQGDPGESSFYLSLEDELMQRFGNAAELMKRLNLPEDVPIESRFVTRAIRSAQLQIEQRNAETRKSVIDYDDVVNDQRSIVYGQRERVLKGENLSEQLRGFIADTVANKIELATGRGYDGSDWDLGALWHDIGQVCDIRITPEDVVEAAGGHKALVTREQLIAELTSDATIAYEDLPGEFDEDGLRNLERKAALAAIDMNWQGHLHTLDTVRSGIGLRAIAQRDPLVEYRHESAVHFEGMVQRVKEQTVALVFNALRHERLKRQDVDLAA